MTNTLDAQLVLRAQCDDREALESLLRITQDRLFSYISGLVGRQRADDVLQDVLLQICKRVKQLRDPELFRPWTYRIASRAALSSLKRERRWQSSQEETVEDLPAVSDGAALVLLNDLSTLLDCVSPASRVVLLLHYIHGYSLDETAAVLGLNVGTVKSRLAWGLSRLRQRLEVNK